VIGQTTTTYFQSLSSTSDDFTTLIASEWVATERLNANTNHTFASWPEFFGPQAAFGDEFTTTQRYNLANTLFDEAAVGDVNGGFVVYGYGNNSAPASAEPPYAAEDIIIVSSSSIFYRRATLREPSTNLASSFLTAYATQPVPSSWK